MTSLKTVFSIKTLALAGVAVAGLGFLASSSEAEARGFRGGGGFHRGGGMHFGGGRHFGHRPIIGHRHHHHHHHGHWGWRRGVVGLGVVTVGSSCYRYRWVDTPYGLVRRVVNVCAY